MSLKEFALALGGPRAQQVADQRRSNRTMEALGTYLGQGASPELAAVYQNNPDAGFKAEGLVQDRQSKLQQQVGNMAEYLEGVDPQYRPQAYAQLVPQLKRAFPGVPVPDVYGPEVEAALPQIRMLAAGARGQGNGTPAQTQVFEAQARAAGLKPGSPEYQKAAQIALGLEGRASSAGYGFDMVEDANGVPRPQRNNPRTGMAEMYVSEQGAWVPLGGGQGQPQGQPMPQGAPQRTYTFGAPAPGAENDPAANLPPEEQQLAGRLLEAGMTFTVQNGRVVPSGMAPREAAPQPASQPVSAGSAPTLDQVPINSYGGGPVNPTLGRGRTKEQEAAAVEAAKLRAGLQFAPEQARAEADAARLKKEAEAQAEATATQNKRSASADDSLSLLAEAERLLPSSTGSGAGAIRDAAGNFVGASTPGAEAIASLKTIAGQLVAKMPRMEGPQSDRDVQMYRDMAGNLADPTIPVPQRMAALNTIRLLQEKYTGSAQAAPAGNAAPAQAAPQGGQYQPGQVIEVNGRRFRVTGGDPNDPDVEEI